MKKTILSLVIVAALMLNIGLTMAADAQVGVTLLNQDPDPAQPGDTLDVRWKITKTGDDPLNNLVVELAPKAPFSLAPGETATRELGDWISPTGEDDYAIIHYKLNVANGVLEDDYPVTISYSYNDNNPISKEYDIRVGEDKTPNFVIGTTTTTPKKLVRDTDEAILQVEISNIGDEQAEHVQVDINLPEGYTPSYTYADKDNLGTITAGESKTATFYVDISEDAPQEQTATILISYKDAGAETNEYKKTQLSLPLNLHDRPQFAIENIAYDNELTPGNTITATIDVKNIGTAEAETTSLRVFKEASQPFSFEEKTDFIGTLKPGETGQASITFTVEDGAKPKQYLIDAEIRTIYNEDVIIEQESFTMDVSDKQGASKKATGTVIAVIAAVIVGGIGYLIGRRRKR